MCASLLFAYRVIYKSNAISSHYDNHFDIYKSNAIGSHYDNHFDFSTIRSFLLQTLHFLPNPGQPPSSYPCSFRGATSISSIFLLCKLQAKNFFPFNQVSIFRTSTSQGRFPFFRTTLSNAAFFASNLSLSRHPPFSFDVLHCIPAPNAFDYESFEFFQDISAKVR